MENPINKIYREFMEEEMAEFYDPYPEEYRYLLDEDEKGEMHNEN